MMATQLLQIVPQTLSQQWVHSGSRFVQHDQRASIHYGDGKRYPPSLTAGHRTDFLTQVVQHQQFGQLHRSLLRLSSAKPEHSAKVCHCFLNAQQIIQCNFLWHVPNVRTRNTNACFRRRMIEQTYITKVRFLKAKCASWLSDRQIWIKINQNQLESIVFFFSFLQCFSYRINVDFPHPLGPSRPYILPLDAFKSTPFNTFSCRFE